MIIPYSVDVPMERWPIANWVMMGVISLVSFAVWLNMAMHDRDNSPEALRQREAQIDRVIQYQIEEKERAENRELTEDEKLAIEESMRPKQDAQANNRRADPTDIYFPLALKPRHFNPLQLFTYQFEHGDIFHLIGNLIFLFVFGNAVNAKLGHGLYLLVFLISGALGAIPFIFLTPMALVGASGSIFGLIGIFLIYYPRNDVSVFYWFGFRIMGAFDCSAYLVIVFYVAWDVIYGIVFHAVGITSPVAHVVQVACACFGALFGVAFVMTRLAESRKGEQNLLQLVGIAPPPPPKKKKKKKKIRREEDDEDYEEDR